METESGGRQRQWQRESRQLLWRLSDRIRQHVERKHLTPAAALGRKGEDLAHRYLRSCGFVVIARNYQPGPDSEVDIIARDRGVLVFVEVKSRRTADFGAPERAISPEKQRHILRAARTFITRSADSWSNVRFDTISVVFTPGVSIVHHKDVFFDGRARDEKMPLDDLAVG